MYAISFLCWQKATMQAGNGCHCSYTTPTVTTTIATTPFTTTNYKTLVFNCCCCCCC